jgi:hypothetical protein
MSVRVAEKNLPRTIGPLFPRTKFRANLSEMQLPRVNSSTRNAK